MNDTPLMEGHGPGRSEGRSARGWRRWLPLLMLLAGSWVIAGLLDYSARTAEQEQTPAGFGKGMLHGACMPATWPALVMGKDPVIYSENNVGRLYKLGYALGVNVCGAVFFGLWFWRWQKWRCKKRQ